MSQMFPPVLPTALTMNVLVGSGVAAQLGFAWGLGILSMATGGSASPFDSTLRQKSVPPASRQATTERFDEAVQIPSPAGSGLGEGAISVATEPFAYSPVKR